MISFNPSYAHVRHASGHHSKVSTKDLAPLPISDQGPPSSSAELPFTPSQQLPPEAHVPNEVTEPPQPPRRSPSTLPGGTH